MDSLYPTLLLTPTLPGIECSPDVGKRVVSGC